MPPPPNAIEQTSHPTPPVMRQSANTHGPTDAADKQDQLQCAAATNHFAMLPFEIKSQIFTFVGSAIDVRSTEKRGLWAYANTSQDARHDVSGFLQETKSGRDIATTHRYAQPEQWRRSAAWLNDNVPLFRNSFARSNHNIINMMGANVSLDLMIEKISTYPAIGYEFWTREFEFEAEAKMDELVAIFSTIRDKPIKLSTCQYEHHNFSNEFRALLSAAHPSCPFIVDLSKNSMDVFDLAELTKYMRSSPSIYRLNLSHNDFSNPDGGVCTELVDLFESLGPVTHLYLKNCQINDETAAAIKPFLSVNTHLKCLDLSGNDLSQAGKFAIIDAVAELNEQLESGMRYNDTIETVILPFDPEDYDVAVADHADGAQMLLDGVALDQNGELRRTYGVFEFLSGTSSPNDGLL